MIGFTYDQIVSRIKEAKGLSDGEIDARVKDKMSKLSDLISREGAAHIVANECGVNLYDSLQKARRYKVGDVVPMMRNIEVAGKVLKVYDTRTFSKNGREGRIGSFMIGDETGRIRVVIWDEKLIRMIDDGKVKEDVVVLVKNAYVKDNNGFKEVHMGGGCALDVNPEGVSVGDVKAGGSEGVQSVGLKAIADLKEGDFAKVRGTLVNLFEPKFYNACPQCSKKVSESNACAEHGPVVPKAVPIVNIFLDDGTDNIRVVFFRDAANSVLKVDDASVLQNNLEKFREAKERMMLAQVEVVGRVNRNEMFDRLEMSAVSVRDSNPKEIVELLK